MIIVFPDYDFPCNLFDFSNEQEIVFDNYRELEKHIQDQLLSNNICKIKNGLSNVLYWGYYRIGYGAIRIKRFRDNVTNIQLQAFADLVNANSLDPIGIKKIGIPQFSGFSFVSKILMFSDPTKFVILDKKIMELRDPENNGNPLSNIPYTKNDSGIRISRLSQKYYYEWCKLCCFIAKQSSNDRIAVDIERGFFKLVEQKRTDYGRRIISSEIKKSYIR